MALEKMNKNELQEVIRHAESIIEDCFWADRLSDYQQRQLDEAKINLRRAQYYLGQLGEAV